MVAIVVIISFQKWQVWGVLHRRNLGCSLIVFINKYKYCLLFSNDVCYPWNDQSFNSLDEGGCREAEVNQDVSYGRAERMSPLGDAGLWCGSNLVEESRLYSGQVLEPIHLIKTIKFVYLLPSFHPPPVTSKHWMFTMSLVNSVTDLQSHSETAGIPESCFRLFACWFVFILPAH